MAWQWLEKQRPGEKQGLWPFFCSKSLDCERLMLGRFELRYWRKTAEIRSGGRQPGGFSSQQRLLLSTRVSPPPQAAPARRADFSNQKLPNYGQLSRTAITTGRMIAKPQNHIWIKILQWGLKLVSGQHVEPGAKLLKPVN